MLCMEDGSTPDGMRLMQMEVVCLVLASTGRRLVQGHHAFRKICKWCRKVKRFQDEGTVQVESAGQEWSQARIRGAAQGSTACRGTLPRKQGRAQVSRSRSVCTQCACMHAPGCPTCCQLGLPAGAVRGRAAARSARPEEGGEAAGHGDARPHPVPRVGSHAVHRPAPQVREYDEEAAVGGVHLPGRQQQRRSWQVRAGGWRARAALRAAGCPPGKGTLQARRAAGAAPAGLTCSSRPGTGGELTRTRPKLSIG